MTPSLKVLKRALVLSEWFYWESCHYHGVEKLNKFSISYMRAWFKFMWLCFCDYRKAKEELCKKK